MGDLYWEVGAHYLDATGERFVCVEISERTHRVRLKYVDESFAAAVWHDWDGTCEAGEEYNIVKRVAITTEQTNSSKENNMSSSDESKAKQIEAAINGADALCEKGRKQMLDIVRLMMPELGIEVAPRVEAVAGAIYSIGEYYYMIVRRWDTRNGYNFVNISNVEKSRPSEKSSCKSLSRLEEHLNEISGTSGRVVMVAETLGRFVVRAGGRMDGLKEQLNG